MRDAGLSNRTDWSDKPEWGLWLEFANAQPGDAWGFRHCSIHLSDPYEIQFHLILVPQHSLQEEIESLLSYQS